MCLCWCLCWWKKLLNKRWIVLAELELYMSVEGVDLADIVSVHLINPHATIHKNEAKAMISHICQRRIYENITVMSTRTHEESVGAKCMRKQSFFSNFQSWSFIPNDLLKATSGTLSVWWRHQMKAFSTLLALCAGNPLVYSGFPSQGANDADSDVSLMWARISC